MTAPKLYRVRVKSFANLYNEGWVASGPLKDHLTKKGCRELTPYHLSFCGKDIEIFQLIDPATGKLSWFDTISRVWSKHVIDWGLPQTTATPPVQQTSVCTCDIKLLWDQGCQCGVFKAEQAAKTKSERPLPPGGRL